ncbi:MAG: hypothetical protein K2Q20_00445, partial [Phycisphaerales bacterium]|nr:hypothetical protein [Phycisphaerales bacterium]
GATIQPGAYFLVRAETAGTTGYAYTPDASFTTGTNLLSTGGKVALTNSTTALAALTCGSLPASVVDLVGYGATGTTGNETTVCPFATTGAAAAPTSSSAVFRQCGGQRDVGQNSTDFRLGVPAPRNSSFVNAATNRHVFTATSSSAAIQTATPGTSITLSATPVDSTATAPGCAAVGGVATVTVDASSIGAGTVSLAGSGFAAWTGSLAVPLSATPGVAVLPITWTDGTGTTGRGNIVLNVPFPPPANNACASASVAALGDNAGTAAGATNDGSSSCQSSAGVDVWWTFSPASTSAYSLDTCTSLPNWDTVLSVHTGCPGTSANQVAGGCVDQGCGTGNLSLIPSVTLNAGTTYVVRVAGWSTTVVGNSYVLRIAQIGSGACCNNTTGACTITAPAACLTTTSAYQGDNTVCTPSPCPPSGSCCNPTTGVCSLSIQSLCASPNVWTSGVTTCTPHPGPHPPPPANDASTAATVAALGSNTGTAANATNDGSSTCQFSAGRDVWLSFTPATSGNFLMSLCSSSPSWDTALSIHTACPGTTANQITGACDDDTCGTTAGLSQINSVALNAGTTYFIRVAGWSTSVLGSAYNLEITALVSGACCNNTSGVCTVTTPAACLTTTSTYQGDNTSCTPSPCPASGSCCNPTTGACTITIQSGCASPNVWTAGATTCTPNPCPQPPPPAKDECGTAGGLAIGGP